MPRCPVCYVPMTRAEEDGLRCHTCPSCFGHWMPGTAMFRRLKLDVQDTVQKSKAPAPMAAPAIEAATSPESADATAGVDGTEAAGAEESPLSDLAAIVSESDSKKPVRCPDCEKFMHKDRFQHLIPVQVDRCKHCDRIWMDTGEYHLIRRLYVELALSTDPQIVHLREKVAAINLAWNGRTTLAQSVGESVSTHTDVASITLDGLFALLTH